MNGRIEVCVVYVQAKVSEVVSRGEHGKSCLDVIVQIGPSWYPPFLPVKLAATDFRIMVYPPQLALNPGALCQRSIDATRSANKCHCYIPSGNRVLVLFAILERRTPEADGDCECMFR